MSIGDAHNCCPPYGKGPNSPMRPPNISGDDAGYNTRLFRNEDDVLMALRYIGYTGDDGNGMVRLFQRHWNRVSMKVSNQPERYRDIPFTYMPAGLAMIDGEIGPQTLNALEIAMLNQRMNEALSWVSLVEIASATGSGYGRRRVYNAAERR